MDRIIVALDVASEKEALGLVKALYPSIKIFKVGNELFTACGPSIVNKIHKTGASVFLDLKYHDIPTTVKKASEAAAKLGVFIFNVHISGGIDMMKAAKTASLELAKKLGLKTPIVLGVTALTSLNSADLNTLGIKRDMPEHVMHLAGLAKDAGLDGVISSPEEIKPLRKKFGKDFIILTPGVRPNWAEVSDHKRVKTPKEAVEDGADYLVIGRPITKAEFPLEAAKRILKEIA